MARIEEKVEELLKETIEKLGYNLYDVEYVKEGPNYYLRVYIDNEKGIDLNDCEKVSNAIDEMLDEANIIKDQYYLEVSSPGIERVLRKDRHLQENIGNQIEIKLFKKDEKGNKDYIGELLKFDQEVVSIKTSEEDEIQIERKNISQIKTVYNW